MRTDLDEGEPGYESCDDGNEEAADDCTNECKPARCGDGILRRNLGPGEEGAESCDDGNDADADACLNNCQPARCGDGVAREDLSEGADGYEACDDGNEDEGDGCRGHCVLAICGDGYTRNDLEPAAEGYEECDGGNDPMSLCGPDCRWAPQALAGLSMGESFTCAVVHGDGAGRTIRCWGRNDVAQVQDGYRPPGGGPDEPLNRIAPRLVDSASLREVEGIRSGYNGTCARVEGRLYCWGYNDQAVMGVPYDGGGNFHPVREPNMIMSPEGRPLGDADVHDMAVGKDHACAIIGEERSLYCWGHADDPGHCCQSYGKTGTRHHEIYDDLELQFHEHIPLPAVAFQAEGGVMAIAAGERFSVAIDEEGTLYYWGRVPDIEPWVVDNTLGTFATVPEGATFRSVSAGAEHVCGLMDDGRVWCDGKRSFGRAGVQAITASRAGFVQVEAYAEGSCALDSEGAVYCWGRNDMGQLGRSPEAMTDSAQPIRIQIEGAGRVISLAKGGFAKHRCVVVQGNTGNALRCWGDNRRGAVGHPTAGDVVVEPFDPDLYGRRTGTQEQPAYSCASLRDAHDSETGGAWLQPPGAAEPNFTWCDQDTDRGGWGLAMVVTPEGGLGEYTGPLWEGAEPLRYVQEEGQEPVLAEGPAEWVLSDDLQSLRTVVYAHQPVRELRLELQTVMVEESQNGDNPDPAFEELEYNDDRGWKPLRIGGNGGDPLLSVPLAQAIGEGSDWQHNDDAHPSIDNSRWEALLPVFPTAESAISRWLQPLSQGALSYANPSPCVVTGLSRVFGPQGNPPAGHHRVRIGIVAANITNQRCPAANRASFIGFGYGGPQPGVGAGAISTLSGGSTVRALANGRIWVR